MMIFLGFLTLMLVVFIAPVKCYSQKGGLYRPLQHIDAAPSMNESESLLDNLKSLAELGYQLSYHPSLQRYTPTRVKRAVQEADVDFIKELRQNVYELITPYVSVHCGADLMYTVDGLYKFVLSAERMQSCFSGENITPNKAGCNCMMNTSRMVEYTGWVVKMLDSFGHMPSGVLHGNFWFLGDFDECMRIRVQTKNQRKPFRTKYCNIDFGYASSPSCPQSYAWDDSLCSRMVALHFGACVPNSCSNEDMRSLVTGFFSEMELFTPKAPSEQTNESSTCICVDSTCHEHDLELKSDTRGLIMLIVVSILGGVMIASSMYDYWIYKPEENTLPTKAPARDPDCKTKQDLFNEQPTLLKILLSFSMVTNIPKILDTTKRPGQIHCLHGIRFFSVSWVILGHTYYWIVPTIDNLIGVYPLTKNFMNQIVLNATLSVDAFFLLSGFLVTYLWLPDAHKSKGKRLSKPGYWITFYLHRYLRLTPVYMLILGVDVALYRYWADGPFWDQNGLEPNYCRRSWWTNLLYVNNFFYPDEQCMSWTWYLANDMQFFVFSPIFLVALFKKEWLGVALTCVTWVITSIVKVLLTMLNNLPPTSMGSVRPDIFDLEHRYWNLVYIKPYCRCGPYLIGILFGFMLFKIGKKRVELPKLVVAGSWLLTTIVHLALLFGLYNYSHSGELPNRPATFFYAVFSRSLWACGLCWVIFACINGYGGVANKILSWGAWIPMGRLTYCAYLLHPLVAHGTYASRHRSFHFDSHLVMVYFFFGHLILSFLAAFIFSLAFESPIMRIETYLLKGDRRKGKKQHPPFPTSSESTKDGIPGSLSKDSQLLPLIQNGTPAMVCDQFVQTDGLGYSASSDEDNFVDATAIVASDQDMIEKARVTEIDDDVIEEARLRRIEEERSEAATALGGTELKNMKSDAQGIPQTPTSGRLSAPGSPIKMTQVNMPGLKDAKTAGDRV